MNLTERLERVAVVGAAGKMGSGIALLLALELAYRALEHPDRLFILTLIDTRDEALLGLMDYLREQAVKEGEKRINRLRKLYAQRPDLQENGEIIQAFADEVMRHVRPGKRLDQAAEARLVFEAAFEKEDLKVGIFQELSRHVAPDTWFLTNTSSIPLHVLADQAGIQGRLLGYHFYNPPAVQKLLEVVTPEDCVADLRILGDALAAALGKTVVHANDIAGFIGNGHFMRDGLQGLRAAQELAPRYGWPAALAMVDTLTRDWLLRPMGIFQLIDYVGVDVFQLILKVMNGYLEAELHSPVIDRMMDQGVKGGQTSLGGQKDGFLQYDKGRVVGVYDLEAQQYVPLDPQWLEALGPRPEPQPTWKGLQTDPEKEAKLRTYFDGLKADAGLGATLAKAHAAASRAAAEGLVKDGVAHRVEDVNRVLTLGFFHLLGPVNDYL